MSWHRNDDLCFEIEEKNKFWNKSIVQRKIILLIFYFVFYEQIRTVQVKNCLDWKKKVEGRHIEFTNDTLKK